MCIRLFGWLHARAFFVAAFVSAPLAFVAGNPAVASGPPSARPNIVFILVDDLGIGEMQWYPQRGDISGYPADSADVIPTPSLYRLAQEGLRLTNYHSPAPVCSPARAAILTGRYPQEFGLRDYLPLDTGRGMPAGIPTIASLLRDEAGYRTGHFGKWHIGDAYPEYMPVHFGFQESLTRNGSEVLAGYKGTVFVEGDDLANKSVVAANEHSAETITRRAIAFAEAAESAGEPYFLNVWYRAPHVPLDPPANFPKFVPGYNPRPASSWPTDWATLVAGIPELAPLAYLQDHAPTSAAKQRAMYIATVAWLDYQIGLLVKRIDELDPSGNTLIVFTSDNGATAKSYAEGDGSTPGTWQPNGLLRDAKRAVYEGGIRAPAVVRWPASSLQPGSATGEFIVGYDFLPTLLDAANVAYAGNNFVGSSFIDVALSQQPMAARSQPMIWENADFGSYWSGIAPAGTLDTEQNRYAVWDESQRRKLVVQPLNGSSNPMLFDTTATHKDGVREWSADDLAASETAEVDALELDYRSWRQEVGIIPLYVNPSVSNAGIDDACYDFNGPSEAIEFWRNPKIDFREGDFSFQARVQLDKVPASGGTTIAEHAGSWSLKVKPVSPSGLVNVTLQLVGKSPAVAGYPGAPGDVLSLSGNTQCTVPCEFNVAFTVLGIADAESSARLYLNETAVAEYIGNSNDQIRFKEVFATETSRVVLGNSQSGQSGMTGKLIDPRFYLLNLSPAEIAAVALEQSGQVCDSGGCH